MEIRLLNDYRAQPVAERTRYQNRLRWRLVDLDPELEHRVPDRALAREQWVQRINRRLARLPQTFRVRIARDLLRRIRELTRSERALERELTGLIEVLRPDLLAEPGIGPITAATLIGRTGGAGRFPTDGHYARQAGVAPIPASSGNTQRVRFNPGGDRQLNCALHRIAFTRARVCPQTRAYLERKQAEGKSRAEAYRCLKRYIALRVWHILNETTDPTPPPATTIHCNHPNSGLALT